MTVPPAERPLADALAAALGAPVAALRSVAGGDIHAAFSAHLDDGRVVFVKTRPDAPPGIFTTEAAGLAWLEEPRALRIPEVLAVADAADGAAIPFLALEWLEPGRRRPDFDARLGRGLAALHAAGPDRFGLGYDNFIGLRPQDNTPADDWGTFYGERRLVAMARQAVDLGQAPAALLREVEDFVAGSFRDRLGPPEPPARLHGDLWGGNLHVAPDGAPALLDPAAYGGHREVDLAMMRLFGGFGPGVFAAYEEAHPLAPGAAERVPLYQLHPVLVHAALFGGGYVASARRIVAQLA